MVIEYGKVKAVAVQCLVDEGLIETGVVEKPESVKLLGAGAVCDSIGLVNYLLALEEKIGAEFNRPIVLMDERAMSQTRSPFLNLATLIDFIVTLLSKDWAGTSTEASTGANAEEAKQ